MTDPANIILLCLFCLAGSFIQRVTGFGFGIFVMTIFPFLLPSYGEATALSGLLAGTNSILIVLQKWKFIVWRMFLLLLITFMVASAICIFYLTRIEEHSIRQILGLVLFFASFYFLFFNKKIHLKPTLPTQISMGTLSGVMGGLFAMQGPPAVLYFLASCPNKDVYIACMQAYLFSGNVMMTVVRGYNGFLTPAVGLAYGFGILFVLLGNFIGGKVFNRISDKVLRRCVYIYLSVSGLVVFNI